MRYSSVECNGKEGSLIASSNALCFLANGEDCIEEWLWTGMLESRVSVNQEMPKCKLIISTTYSDNKKPIALLFEDEDKLETARKDIEFYIKAAVEGNRNSISRASGEPEIVVESVSGSDIGNFSRADDPDIVVGSSDEAPTTKESESEYFSLPAESEIALEASVSEQGGGENSSEPLSSIDSKCIDRRKGDCITNMRQLSSMISLATVEEKQELIAALAVAAENCQQEEALEANLPSSTPNRRVNLESSQESSNTPIKMSPIGDLDPVHEQSSLTLPLFQGSTHANGSRRVSSGRTSTASASTKQDLHSPFGETTNTFMYLSEVCSHGFWYSIFIYTLQMAAISLTLADIVSKGVPGNALNLPPMVDWTVTCAQAIALFLALAYQSDMIQGLLKLLNGFYPKVLEEYPGAVFSKWLMSCMAQLLAGILLSIDCFILTMQASRVIEVMLNLTALLFMAEIDDIGFWLAKAGFISSQLQREAWDVVDFKVPKRMVKKVYRRILYLLALIGVFIGYGILKNRQLMGDYLQTHIFVQFSGEYNPKIPFYSGTFKARNLRTAFHRDYRDLGTGEILLAYCDDEKVWTFSDANDPCDYFAKSTKTTSYDATSIPDTEWEVLDSINRLRPFQSFTLLGQDCNPLICQGDCVDSLCVCPHDRFGIDCEFFDVCPELSIDLRTEPFPKVSMTRDAFALLYGGFIAYDEVDLFHPLSDKFELLKNKVTDEYVRVYNMPVFYSTRTYPANIIFFGGNRWILTTEMDLLNITDTLLNNSSTLFFPEKTVDAFLNGFHGYQQATYTPSLLSDPVDFKSPDFLPTPSGLGWWTVGVANATTRHYVPDYSLSTVLLCSSCNANYGGYCDARGGVCNQTTGKCDCKPPYEGDRCEQFPSCADLEKAGAECYNAGVCDTGSGVCRCELPYYGELCTEIYNCFEEYGSCQNRGVCDLFTGRCICTDPATSGELCELKLDCQIHGCENGGACSISGQCACRPPFYGTLCDLVDTTQKNLLCSGNSDCHNGICNTDTGICQCKKPGSFGSLCEHQYNCSSSSLYICSNQGTCNDTTGICDCPELYYGHDCSRAHPCTDNMDCNGFWCEGGACQCGYVGSFLEHGKSLGNYCELDWQNKSNCECFGRGACERDYDGSCVCDEPLLHRGPHCDKLAYELFDDSEFLAAIKRCGFPPFLINASEECQYLDYY